MAFQGHLHAGNRPGKAVGGGTHLLVECSYQVSPNIHTKYALYSELDWLAYGYLTCLFLSVINCTQ